MKIILINGPNLNLLGKRDASKYGTQSLNEIELLVKNTYPEIEFEFFQSNLEGEIIDIIQSASEKYDGLIINPGGYSHTSVAIRDALEICSIPKIEVHLSNLSSREDFRSTSITASVCNGYLSGFRENGYLAAVYLIQIILT